MRTPHAALCMLLLLAACGGDAIDTGTNWIIPEDAAPWPDGLSGDDAGTTPDSDCCDTPDTLPPDVVTLDTTPPDTELLCTPDELICDGLDIMECAESGLSWSYVGSCDDGDPCTEDICLVGECLYEPSGTCCDPPCEIGELCFNGECVCAAQCLGKECGDDGCGGSCGECPEQHHCTPAGACVCDPACEGKVCGPDGCGGDCGLCLGPQDLCTEDGLCVCQPACEGKICGPDGCGGDCGTCPGPQDVCTDEGLCLCVPDCEEKICGGDGCGGTCGTCNTPLYLCDLGSCIQDSDFAPVLGGSCTPYLSGPSVFYLCENGKKWNDAKDYCGDHGTWLATITTAEEQAFLVGLAGSSGQPFWIGLSQGFWEWDPFVWITEEDMLVEYWGPDEPNDGGFFEGEDCGEMTPSGAWNDTQCGDSQWFVCEYAL